jgi:hypothetical protein
VPGAGAVVVLHRARGEDWIGLELMFYSRGVPEAEGDRLTVPRIVAVTRAARPGQAADWRGGGGGAQ